MAAVMRHSVQLQGASQWFSSWVRHIAGRPAVQRYPFALAVRCSRGLRDRAGGRCGAAGMNER